MSSINGDMIVTALVVLAAFAALYNTLHTAQRNHASAEEEAKKPLQALEAKHNALEGRVAELERGQAAHADDIRDLHAGQSALCLGVQALLEHELHNGNESEMSAASKSIGDWLRNR